MKPRIFFFLLVFGVFSRSTFAEEKNKNSPNLIPVPTSSISQCESPAAVHIVGQKVYANSAETCYASAKIQAIAYECGRPEDTYSFVQNALQENIVLARAQCDVFCKKISRSCEGLFNAPLDCGLKSPPGKALDFGKKTILCPANKCKGQAFNYCSLYHGNFFFTNDTSLFKDAKENCTCRKR